MKRFFILMTLLNFFNLAVQAEDTTEVNINAYLDYLAYIDSVEQTLEYQQGKVVLGDDLATIIIPKGFKYLNAEQSNYVLTELWGNPPSDVLGMLFPDSISPLSDNFTYAIEISYSEDGYVDDEDAQDINYTELLEELQKDTEQENVQRKIEGYETYKLIGWAQAPYYDAESKKLHWAKELKFEGTEVNTLNYNFRVLGRKGYLVLNAIGDIDILPLVNEDADKILTSISFNEGNKYSEFNPEIDKVAAYGVGGLVAGKVLAKTGLLAGLLKFGKFIFFGIAGLFAAFRKKIFGGGRSEQA